MRRELDPHMLVLMMMGFVRPGRVFLCHMWLYFDADFLLRASFPAESFAPYTVMVYRLVGET